MSFAKGALAAAKRLRAFPYDVAPQDAAAVNDVMAALEAAAQEAEAWEAVHQWRRSSDSYSYKAGFDIALGFYFECYLGAQKVCGFYGITRLEVLLEAAAWCLTESK